MLAEAPRRQRPGAGGHERRPGRLAFGNDSRRQSGQSGPGK